MPQAGVQPVEDAIAHHEDLAHQRLLGGTAEALDRAGQPVGVHRRLDRERRAERRRRVAAMAAAVPRPTLNRRRAVRDGLLRKPRQRVQFRHHTDHGAASAIRRHERRGHPRDATLHGEAVRFQDVSQQRARLVLLQAHFGPCPRLLVRVHDEVVVRVNPADDRLFVICIHFVSIIKV